MATGRLTMRKTREILRQKWELGRSHREVALSLGLSAGTIAATLARAQAAGLTAEQLGGLSEEALEEKLYGKMPMGPAARPLPDCAALDTELRRPGVSLQLLHIEYLQAHPDGYRYSQFDGYEHVCRRCKALKLKVVHTERHQDSAPRSCLIHEVRFWPRSIPRKLRFHDLRHSCAAVLLRAGVDVHRVQRILRHADVRTTTGTCAHLGVENLRHGLEQTYGLAAAAEPIQEARAVSGNVPARVEIVPSDLVRQASKPAASQAISEWAEQGPNLRQAPCKGAALPLSYPPQSPKSPPTQGRRSRPSRGTTSVEVGPIGEPCGAGGSAVRRKVSGFSSTSASLSTSSMCSVQARLVTRPLCRHLPEPLARS